MSKQTTTEGKKSNVGTIILMLVLAGIFVGVGLFTLKLGKPKPVGQGEIAINLQRFKMVAPFDLIDQNSQPVNQDAFDDKVTIVNFIFTSCAAECPFLSRRMEEVQAEFADNPNVQLMSVTVDPRTDNPERLKNYGETYNAGPKWRFLTGDTKIITKLIKESFLLPAEEAEEKKVYLTKTTFVHSEKIAVVDQLGVVRFYADGMNPNAGNALVQATEKLLAIGN
ncbi:MAG: SCO family protein [Verrucomicrobiota bacterium]